MLLPGGHISPRRQEVDRVPYRCPQGALNSEQSDRGTLCLEELKCHSLVEGSVSEGQAQELFAGVQEREVKMHLTGAQVQPAPLPSPRLVAGRTWTTLTTFKLEKNKPNLLTQPQKTLQGTVQNVSF